MGRWRPPAPQSSPHMTPEGAAALRAELDDLWRRKRPEVTRALSAAAAEGDRSENAEYIYRKKQLGEIDRRIRYLRKRLDVVRPVSGVPRDPDRIYFGAWITLAGSDGSERVYRIVGADETDAAAGLISVDSPLARAMLGRACNEAVTVETPEGLVEWEVVDIRYPEPDAGGDST